MIEVVKKFVEGGDALGGIPSVESVTEVEAGPLQRGKEWRRVVVDGPASSGTSQRIPPGTCSPIAPAIAPASSRRCSVRARALPGQLLALLGSAPEDDEATSAEEDASAREAWAEYRRGESVPLEQVRCEAS